MPAGNAGGLNVLVFGATGKNGKPPVRFGVLYVPNGFNMSEWKAGKAGGRLDIKHDPSAVACRGLPSTPE